MKKIVIIGLREGVRDLNVVDRLNEEFNVIGLAKDINLVAKHLKGFEVSAIDLKDHSHKDFYGQISSYLDSGITDFKYDELDEYLKKCDGVILVGAPAKAGTEKAFLDTTLINSIFSYTLNGQEIGEIGLFKEIANYYGKEILLVLGDEAAENEAKSLQIPAISVKKSTFRNYCTRYSYDDIDSELETFFANGFEIKQAISTNKQFDLLIEFIRPDFAFDFLKLHDRFITKDPRTLYCHYDKLKCANDLLLLRREL